MKLCECGCGEEVTRNGNRFIKGHHKARLGKKHSKESKEKMSKIHKLKEVKEKTKQTCIKNWGFENPGQSKEIKEKIKQKCLEHWGEITNLKCKETKHKIKQTNLKKRGVENSMQSKEVQEKARQTNLNHRGVEYPNQSKEVQEKFKQTNKEKYGYEYPMQSEIVKEKFKHTCLDHFGEDNWIKTLQGKQYSRINSIRLRDNQLNNGEPASPFIGDTERSFLNELQKYTGYKIIRNDPSFKYTVGFFPDGHIPELKLFIEFDERQHFVDNYKTYKQKDIDRQLILASLGYIIFRISKKDWNENKDQVISHYQSLITQLSEQIKNFDKEFYYEFG